MAPCVISEVKADPALSRGYWERSYKSTIVTLLRALAELCNHPVCMRVCTQRGSGGSHGKYCGFGGAGEQLE